MNRVVLIGNAVRDSELRFTPGGTGLCFFTLAVDRDEKYRGGEADYINVKVWGKRAEAAAGFVKKGSLIMVSGSLRSRSYTAEDGTKRYPVEVEADNILLLQIKPKDKSQDFTPSKEDVPF